MCGAPVETGVYTLGKLGAVAEGGAGSKSSLSDAVGESGGMEDAPSAIRDKERVKSSDCARACMERGLLSFSLIFSCKRESDPRL